MDPARRDPGPALPDRGRPAPDAAVRHRARRPPARLPARRPGHAGRDACSATGWPRSTRPSTGRPGRCPSPGWSTPPSTSSCSSSCARCSAPSWSRPARTAGPARSSSGSRPSPRRSRVDQWRRTSGLHKVRGRRALAAVRALWTTRDQIADRARRHPGPDHPGLRDRRGGARAAHDPHGPAGHQGLPRPRRRSLRRPLGRRADPGTRPARGRAADAAPRSDGPPPPARLGRQGPGRRPASAARPRGDHRARPRS